MFGLSLVVVLVAVTDNVHICFVEQGTFALGKLFQEKEELDHFQIQRALHNLIV